MESQRVVVFTDGACKNNGKPNAISSIGVYFPNGEFENISKMSPFDEHTNERAEIEAIIEALAVTVDRPVVIYTDSKYCFNIITVWLEKWLEQGKEKLNWDLILKLKTLLDNRDVKMVHVRGHERIINPITPEDHIKNEIIAGNNMADHLANLAIAASKKLD